MALDIHFDVDARRRSRLADDLARRYCCCVLRFSLMLIIVVTAATMASCTTVALPPQVTLSEVEPSGKPAKPPDCDIPVLRLRPLQDYREVAIIEGLGNRFVEEKDVLPLVRAKGCESGADAIVIQESRAQTSEQMTGYYINAIAIVYGKPHPTVEQRTR